DAESRQEDGRGQHDPRGPERPRRAYRSPAPADPDAAGEEVDERRICKRDAREDVALVEVPQRDRRKEEDGQVEVAEGEGPAKIGEAEHEQRAEREPDRNAVDLLAAERALVAARH